MASPTRSGSERPPWGESDPFEDNPFHSRIFSFDDPFLLPKFRDGALVDFGKCAHRLLHSVNRCAAFNHESATARVPDAFTNLFLCSRRWGTLAISGQLSMSDNIPLAAAEALVRGAHMHLRYFASCF